MGLPNVLFKKSLQFRMGIPGFLTGQENFKQLCFIFITHMLDATQTIT